MSHARSIRRTLTLLAALPFMGCSSEDGGGAAGTEAAAGTAGAVAGTLAGATAAGTGVVAGESAVAGASAGVSGLSGQGGEGGAAGVIAAGEGGTAGVAAGDGAGLGGMGGEAGTMDAAVPLNKFSFFITSFEGMKRLSGSELGFGGDLGGLAGADSICQQLAEAAGGAGKTWRAFLSTSSGGANGGPVHAIERIGQGPWYDANDRLVAMDIAGLLTERPEGDPQTVDDLPDENGQPLSVLGNSHDILTGSDAMGRFPATADAADTCQDWTSAEGPGSGDRIMCGHSYPRCAEFGGCGGSSGGMMGFFGGMFPGFPGGGGFGNGSSWVSDHAVSGCRPGVNFIQNGPGDTSSRTVGAGGGFGGIYCFAVAP